MNRRDSIRNMIALAVAPALIKIEMLMPVKEITDYINIPSLTENIEYTRRVVGDNWNVVWVVDSDGNVLKELPLSSTVDKKADV